MRRTYVICDASADDASECTFLNVWTPRGLTTGAPGPYIAMAKLCGWDAISVTAESHAAACAKARAIFTRKRARRWPKRWSAPTYLGDGPHGA